MKVSIIIPAYNCETYISRCVESIYNQNYSDFEVIIVDDGSVDGTNQICHEMEREYSNLHVVHKENGGVSSARNIGIEHASGEFLLFVDADDFLIESDYIESLLLMSEYDYVVAGYSWMDASKTDDKEVKKSTRILLSGCGEEELPEAFFVKGWFHTCWAKLYRSSIIKKEGIRFQPYRVSEDSMFNLEYISKASSWAIVNNTGYCYFYQRTGVNALSKYHAEDIDTYISLHRTFRRMSIKNSIVHKTMYAQYLALCLRVKRCGLSNKEKRTELKRILAKPMVRYTLMFHIGNLGEWLTGLKICLLNW